MCSNKGLSTYKFSMTQTCIFFDDILYSYRIMGKKKSPKSLFQNIMVEWMLVHAACLQLYADTSVSVSLTNDAVNMVRWHLTLEIRTKLEGCCQNLSFITVRVYHMFCMEKLVIFFWFTGMRLTSFMPSWDRFLVYLAMLEMCHYGLQWWSVNPSLWSRLVSTSIWCHEFCTHIYDPQRMNTDFGDLLTFQMLVC